MMQVSAFQTDTVRNQSSSMGPVNGRQIDRWTDGFNEWFSTFFRTDLELKKQLATTVKFVPLLLCNCVDTERRTSAVPDFPHPYCRWHSTHSGTKLQRLNLELVYPLSNGNQSCIYPRPHISATAQRWCQQGISQPFEPEYNTEINFFVVLRLSAA